MGGEREERRKKEEAKVAPLSHTEMEENSTGEGKTEMLLKKKLNSSFLNHNIHVLYVCVLYYNVGEFLVLVKVLTFLLLPLSNVPFDQHKLRAVLNAISHMLGILVSPPPPPSINSE